MIKGGTTGQEFIMIRISSACPPAAFVPDHQSNLASSVVGSGCVKALRQQTGFPATTQLHQTAEINCLLPLSKIKQDWINQ